MRPDERHRRVTDLFHEVCDLPPEARASVLARVRRDDPEVADEVDALLAHDASPEVDVGAGTVPRAAVALAGAIASALQSSELQANRVVVEGFRLDREIGRGGMGVVFAATDESTQRQVALKLLNRSAASDSQRRRFRIEAAALAQLDHPGIARVIRASDDAEQPWIAMELVDGEPLGSYVAQKQLDTAARAGLLAKLCDAVQHAHDRGFVHRDLKPGNVVVTPDGQPKVLDFGIVHPVSPDVPVESAHTVAGHLLGTACYMSPEQMSGDPAALDARADIFSLGVLAYEVFSGTLPYGSKSMGWQGVAQAHYKNAVRALDEVAPAVPARVAAAVMQAIALQRSDRLPTAAAFGSALRSALPAPPAPSPALPEPAAATTAAHAAASRASIQPVRGDERRSHPELRAGSFVWGVAGLAATLFVGLVFVTVLLVRAWTTANDQTERADAARAEAEAARAEATKARADAEQQAARVKALESAAAQATASSAPPAASSAPLPAPTLTGRLPVAPPTAPPPAPTSAPGEPPGPDKEAPPSPKPDGDPPVL